MVTPATKAEQTTWADWLPDGQSEPPQLITRAELLAELAREGVDVPERMLTFWESSGVLPRPVRRWRDGAPKALYPLGWQALVATVRAFQDQGLPLSDIATEVRVRAGYFLGHGIWAGAVYLDAVKALDDLARADELDGMSPIHTVEIRYVDAGGKPVGIRTFHRGSQGGLLENRVEELAV
jgi:hypothetical protein